MATIVMISSVATTGSALAAPALTATITVHAGGIRSAPSTVTGLTGALFTATPVGAGAPATCLTGPGGGCAIAVLPGAYFVTETVAPVGYYLDPALDYGDTTTGTATPYRFRTANLAAGTNVDVPGPSAAGSYNDAVSPGSPFSGQLATSLNNPAVSRACGLKIGLILDQSGSMKSGTKQADLKLAANKVITSLTGTPSQMAIFTFASSTGGSVPLTAMGSAAQAAPLTNFINGLGTPSGATNWDQGLYQAVTASKTYDLVVVLTDGNPTTDRNGSGGGNTVNFHNVENGIYSANAIKNLGSRLVAIGIGVDGGQDNLRAISGPTLDSDYYLGTEGDFDDVFKQLATGNCNGIITVQKNIQDFQGNPIPNSAAANGWNFAGTVSSPAANLTFPATATVNGATGFTQSTVTIPVGGTPTITVTETLNSAYTFVGAICSVNGVSATTAAAGTAIHPGVSFAAAAGVPLACTFTNKQVPPTSSLAVQKLDGTTNLPVAGATFQLFREASAGIRNPAVDAPLGSCSTAGSPAQCVSVATLTFGTYYWVETAAPTGYLLPGAGAASYSAAFTIDATHTGTPAATLSVTDAQITSSLAVKKLDGSTNASLPGAAFKLHREALVGTRAPATDFTVATCTTLAGNTPANTCAQAGLTFGTYYWEETAAPAGYVLPSGVSALSAEVTIDPAYATLATTAVLSVSDAQTLSSLAVRKLDATTNQPVAGATFQLYRESTAGTQNPTPGGDAALGTCTTVGSPAQCASGLNLTFGTYYWVETVAPAGYVLPASPADRSTPYPIDATHNGATVSTLTVSDPQVLSSLAVQKLDGTSPAHPPVAGARFQLYRELNPGTPNPGGDTALGACTTAGSPAQCVSAPTLIFGTYYWVETAAPAGYVLPSGIAAYSAAFTIDAAHTGASVATLTVSDAQVTSALAVKKIDATTGESVAGATFKLRREAIGGTQAPATDATVGTCTTLAANKPANTCSLAGLTFGTYYWQETGAPTGYVLPSGPAALSAETTINAGYATLGTAAVLTVSDAQVLSSLAVRKLDGTTGLPVPGAIFQLYREAVAGTDNPAGDPKIGAACTTVGSAARCIADSLTFGTYYWVETAAPVGYVLPASPTDRSAPTTIDAGYAAAGATTTVSVTDAQVLSSLAVRKLDTATGNPVNGAKFQLYREAVVGTRDPLVDTPVDAPCTTATGNTPANACTSAGLSFGTYYWVETAAPVGYVLPAAGPARYSAPATISAATAGQLPITTLSVSDAQQTSALAVKKLDATSGLAADGASFQLYREVTVGAQNPAVDTLVGPGCTTAAGNTPADTCSGTGLGFGTYYWVETAAPVGYVLPVGPAGYSAPQTIDAAYAAAGTVTTLLVFDPQILSSLAVRKLDGTTNQPLAGATFQLYRELAIGTQNPIADTKVTTCTTAGSPAACSSAATLTFGTYYWVETVAPAGYVLPASPADRSAPTTVDATHTGTPDASVTVTDAQLLASLAVQKLDGTTNQPVAGATFQLYREVVVGTQNPIADTKLTTCTTAGSPAACASATTLTFGTYYWVETVAPTGYVLPASPADRSAPATIGATNTGTPAATLAVTDAQVLSSLAVQKRDSTTSLPVAGATFQLYREAVVGTQNPAGDTSLTPCTTSGTPAGCASAATLTFGTYYWVETIAPVGYVLPVSPADRSAPITINATNAGTPVATLTVTDAQTLSSLAVAKLDATTSTAVAGATFQLYREVTAGARNPAADTKVTTCTTTGTPAACASAATLTFGTYYWVETIAPAGYVLPASPADRSPATVIDAAYAAAGATATVTVADDQQLSSLAVQKFDGTTHLPVAGATFQLYREAVAGTQNPAGDTPVGATCTTTGSPAACASAATLTFGTYYWVETSAPTGYVLPASPADRSASTLIDATHVGAPVATVMVTDQQILSSLAVRKLDGTTNQPVAGATFQLYREGVAGTQNPAADTTVGAACTTAGSPAQCVADSLNFGIYYWVETAAPTGYVLPASPADRSAPTVIDGTHTGTPVATVRVADAQQLSSLAVRKLDGSTGLPIAGATFQLYREAAVGIQDPAADTAIGACTTAGSPAQCVSAATLTFATYYWVETDAPVGYVLPASPGDRSAPTTIDAASTGTPAATVTVTDAQTLSSLAVRKLDGTTDLAVAGATFQLYREAAAGTQNPAGDTTITTCTTVGSPAACASGATLTFGTYYWVETDAPVGYVLPTSPADRSAPTTIDAGYAAAGDTTTVSVNDAQVLSSVAVQKIDASTGHAVDGATFQLYREITPGAIDPAGDDPVGAACTTAAGNCSRSALTFGTYYWVETAAPTGYVLPIGAAANSAAVTIDAEYAVAGTTATLSVDDAQVTSILTVRKTDESSNALAGATFQLWRTGTPDTQIGPCTTGALGTCSVDGLAFGTYYWVETQAPTFYELPDNPVSDPIVVAAGTAGSTFTPSEFADPSTPVATVTKTVVSTTQNADGTWTVGYDLAVTNPSAKYATTYELADTLGFGTGITVNSSSVAAPAGVTADPGWDGSAPNTVVVSGQPLAASTTDHYTVTVNATVAVSANRVCADGGGFANTGSVSLQAAQPVAANQARTAAATLLAEPGQNATACSEPVSPAIAKTFDSAVQHLVGGVWDGSEDIAYTVTVTNPSTTTGLVYSLNDTPSFPADVSINGAAVTGTDGTNPITVTPGWNGTSNSGFVTGRALPAFGTDTYTVIVNASVPADADPAELSCVTGVRGHGFDNSAVARSGSDTFTADACGDIPALTAPLINKTVTGSVQNADGSWTVTYDLAVTNPDPSLSTAYDLSDLLAFGHGITITGASVSGPAGASVNPGWNGVDDSGIIAHRVIAAGVSEHYTVAVSATVGSTATITDRDCTVDVGEAGTGFLNGATVSTGTHGSTVTACAAPGSPTVVKTVVSVTQAGTSPNWTVVYAVTVANASAADVTYSLTDDPGLALGVETTGTTVSWLRAALDGSAPTASTDVTGWIGIAPDDVLAAERTLPAGAKDTYTVTLTVAVPSDLADNVIPCSTNGAGHGYFNAAVLTSGGDTFPVSACAPIFETGVGGDTVLVPTPPYSGPLAFTGVQAGQLIWLAVGLLTAGVALLVLLGRRRPQPGDVR